MNIMAASYSYCSADAGYELQLHHATSQVSKREANRNWYGMHLAQFISSNKIMGFFPLHSKSRKQQNNIGKG